MQFENKKILCLYTRRRQNIKKSYTDKPISNDNIAEEVKDVKKQYEGRITKHTNEKWREKSLHDQYPARFDRGEMSLSKSQ